MDKTELTPIEWYAKVNESLTLALRDVRDGRFPSEKHLTVMEALFPVYHNGELPMYKSLTTTTGQIVSQGGLFADSITENKGKTNQTPQGHTSCTEDSTSKEDV